MLLDQLPEYGPTPTFTAARARKELTPWFRTGDVIQVIPNKEFIHWSWYLLVNKIKPFFVRWDAYESSLIIVSDRGRIRMSNGGPLYLHPEHVVPILQKDPSLTAALPTAAPLEVKPALVEKVDKSQMRLFL